MCIAKFSSNLNYFANRVLLLCVFQHTVVDTIIAGMLVRNIFSKYYLQNVFFLPDSVVDSNINSKCHKIQILTEKHTHVKLIKFCTISFPFSKFFKKKKT